MDMKLILCVDDQGGVAFHHRRQSQDRAVRKDMLQMCGETKLWVRAYTAQQFDMEQQSCLRIVNTFEDAKEFCFIEDDSAKAYMNEAEKVILYHWNRKYPSDTRIPLPMTGWKRKECTEFSGYSHEKITKEVYIR